MFGSQNKRERVLILGLGGVGYYLAKRLEHEEYAVTALEPDPAALRQADDNLDVRLIRGGAMDIDCWHDAAAETMTSVIAVTDNDAINMMAVQIAEKFGIPNKIARVRSLQFGLKESILSSEDLKVDLLIHPEELVAQEIVRMIKLQRDRKKIFGWEIEK